MHFERNEVKLYIKVFNEWKLHNFLWDWEKGRGKQLVKIDGVVYGSQRESNLHVASFEYKLFISIITVLALFP